MAYRGDKKRHRYDDIVTQRGWYFTMSAGLFGAKSLILLSGAMTWWFSGTAIADTASGLLIPIKSLEITHEKSTTRFYID